MSEKVRYGIVGAGGVAQSYGQAFASSAESQLVAVADVRPEAARTIAEAFGCKAFTVVKLAELVVPTMLAVPSTATAMSNPVSSPEPPRAPCRRQQTPRILATFSHAPHSRRDRSGLFPMPAESIVSIAPKGRLPSCYP